MFLDQARVQARVCQAHAWARAQACAPAHAQAPAQAHAQAPAPEQAPQPLLNGHAPLNECLGKITQ